MRVIFLEDVSGVAQAGEVKEVKNGFARNYLLPRSLAAPATHDQLQRVAIIQTAANQRRVKEEEDALALAELLKDVSLTLTARVSPTGRFYGGITSTQIAEEMARTTGREIERRAIALAEPIREPGVFPIEVRLGHGVSATIQVTVQAEQSHVAARPAPRRASAEAPEARAAAPEPSPAVEPVDDAEAADAEAMMEERF